MDVLEFFSFTKYVIDIGQVCWKFATYMPLWSIGLLREWQRIGCFVCVVVNQKSWAESTTVSPIGSMYGIFTYIYHRNHLNVGEYTSPMDPMGDTVSIESFGMTGFHVLWLSSVVAVWMTPVTPSQDAADEAYAACLEKPGSDCSDLKEQLGQHVILLMDVSH